MSPMTEIDRSIPVRLGQLIMILIGNPNSVTKNTNDRKNELICWLVKALRKREI